MVSPDGACSTNTLKKAFIPPQTPLCHLAAHCPSMGGALLRLT